MPSEYCSLVTIRLNNRISHQRVADIDYLTAAANYVDIHIGQEVLRTRSTISDLERQLDPQMFGRIHRKTIVNLNQVKECCNIGRGDYLITLRGGQQLKLSRRYRLKVQNILDDCSCARANPTSETPTTNL